MGGPPPAEQLAREAYARHGAELYGFAVNRLGDTAAAQDAVQETIVRVWKAADRFDAQKGSLRTWVFAIARRVVIDQAAEGQRAARLGGRVHEWAGAPATTDPTGPVDDADEIVRGMSELSDDHRQAIVETYLRDRPYDEVARELGVSVSTLRSRVFHGLRHLRRTMTRREP